MKYLCKLFCGLAFVLGCIAPSSLLAQLPSDTTTLPFVVDEMVDAIKSCYENQTLTNEYAYFLSDEPYFPSINIGNALSEAEVDQLKTWIKNNPSSIEKYLIRRKKNYDTYFNPALQE